MAILLLPNNDNNEIGNDKHNNKHNNEHNNDSDNDNDNMRPRRPRPQIIGQPRENMVGVNMVLAEYRQIQTWLV